MKCEFCEKMYETFVNHELLSNGCKLWIPSQNEERQGGFDSMVMDRHFQVCCLQYKIPEYTKSRRPFWGGQKVFKFYAHKDVSSNKYKQHNLLVQLNRMGIQAYYCAPHFIQCSDLYNNLASLTLLSNSALLKPIYKLTPSPSHVIEYDKS